MKLVIAEKPMLGRDIARAICGVPVTDSTRLPISGNGYTVISCIGHILELKEPEVINPKWKWDSNFTIEQLPIYSEDWELVCSKGNLDLLKHMGELLEKCDYVIHAGDPDDEGQLIVDEVLGYHKYNGNVKRVFVNDNIEKNIVKAFESLHDNEQYVNLGRAAYARQMADFCFGVSESRLAGIRLRRSVSVGRVQTPTLGLVVKRDEEIENHLKRAFYDLFAICNLGNINDIPFKLFPADHILGGDKRIYNEETVKDISNKVLQQSGEISTKISTKTNHPPLPYNLTTLQSDMNKIYGYGASETLDVTQVLRDKHKAITYNRSDCQYLKEEHHKTAKNTLGCAMKNLRQQWELDYSISSKAFNENNVTAHHGIIPQESSFDASKLSEKEYIVYNSIVERYALQFLSPEIREVSESTFSTEYGNFTYKASRIIDPGYKQLLSSQHEDEEDDIQSGQPWIDGGTYSYVIDDTKIEEKETSPPKHYTQGSLITDMASIAKYVEDPEIMEILKRKDNGKKGEHGGIGTVATRAEIIKKLISKEFIEENGKKIISTEKGRLFYNMLPSEIKSADTTAKWWIIQESIAEGKEDVNAVQRSVCEVFNNHKDTAYTDAILENKPTVIGKCPTCGADVIERKSTWSCSSNKFTKHEDGSWERTDGCGFRIIKSMLGKKLPEKAIKELMENGKTSKLVRGFKSKKTGKKFDAYVELDPQTGAPKLAFKK